MFSHEPLTDDTQDLLNKVSRPQVDLDTTSVSLTLSHFYSLSSHFWCFLLCLC